MGRAFKLAITIIITLVSVFIMLTFDAENNKVIPSGIVQTLDKFYSDLFTHAMPMMLCALFGMMGAFVKNLLNRDEEIILNNKAVQAKKAGDEDSDTNVMTAPFKKYVINQELDSNNILIGAIFGIIGYLVLSSKFIVRLFYPDVDFGSGDISFIGMAVCGILFGYFAREFAGMSNDIIIKKLRHALKNDSAK